MSLGLFNWHSSQNSRKISPKSETKAVSLHHKTKKPAKMSEVELILVRESDKCTMYTIQFLSEDKNEFQRFIAKFKDDATYNPDFVKIVNFITQISERGALERYFRPEGKMKDGVCALPTISSKLRLYCLRLSDSILVLGNGDVKDTKTYDENDTLKGYVINLQKFEELLKEGVKDGSVKITKTTIETDKTFEL